MSLVNGSYLHLTNMKKFQKIFFTETAGLIWKQFHGDVSLFTLFKRYSCNFTPSITLHYSVFKRLVLLTRKKHGLLGKGLLHPLDALFLSHSHTVTPFDTPGKQAV